MKSLQKMFDHMQWADTRIVELLRKPESENPKALGLFAHILQAELVWLTRLQGKDTSSLVLWADNDLDTCAQLVERNREGYSAYLAGLAESELDRFLKYRNQSGKEFDNSIRDILSHVALHGQYHRGQINAHIRAGGGEPVNVDFITFVR